MKQTLLTRQDLASRWGFESTNSIAKYETEGIIKRVPGIPIPRYSLSQIEEIEEAGLELNPMSPAHRRKLERRIEELEREVEMYKAKIENAKIALG